MIRKVFTLIESLKFNIIHSSLTFTITVIKPFLHCYNLYNTPHRSSLDSSPSPTHQYLLSPMSNSSSAKPSPFRESRQGHGFGQGMYSSTDNTYGDQNIARWDRKIVYYLKVLCRLSTRYFLLRSHHQNQNKCLFDGHAISPSLSICISFSLSISLSISLHLSLHLSLSFSISLSVSLSLSIYLCLALSLILYLSLYLSFSLSPPLTLLISIPHFLSLSIYLSVCPSLYLSLSLTPSYSLNLYPSPSLSPSNSIYRDCSCVFLCLRYVFICMDVLVC